MENQIESAFAIEFAFYTCRHAPRALHELLVLWLFLTVVLPKEGIYHVRLSAAGQQRVQRTSVPFLVLARK